ncbi:phosphoenolpyruvate--protein phosphotransferase [Mucisphaera calidilacus]|uniref:Phosphoenolpyruvate-protein phosphotransferase n=1 Tax=Mucisphaera calidilacus TaxID=2527982 RepID=A0A518BVL3_9BACT|nr:phosphoenolpyruvate--protein phosphotransferase [Mucisphaera calidilacus]QDU70987.1 Phosphoenolpyruvate-protein phosphotransferase [Mucisphaera calidilacus]
MLIKQGIPVSPGVALHKALVLDSEDQPVPRRTVPASRVLTELTLFDEAVARSIKQLRDLEKQTTESLGSELARIFAFHIGMLNDTNLLDQVRTLIRADRVTAEYAVSTVLRRLEDVFLEQDASYFRDRVGDINDLERRVLKELRPAAKSKLHDLTEPVVLIAHDLTPSQTADFDRSKVMAIAIDAGGRTSHTAILAHALGIPAVVGLGDLTQSVTSGDAVIIDGNLGRVVISPDSESVLAYQQAARRFAAFTNELAEIQSKPAETTDGVAIELLANIEFPTEIHDALAQGAVGVGLYRTEFLYLGSESPPSEDEQVLSYVEAIRSLDGRPLTIRTLDLGADKVAPGLGALTTAERNPFLGCRSIRLCLQNLPMFRTQIRAILRASAEGPVRVMFPLISNINELRQARMIFSDVCEDLEDQGIPFNEDIPIGMMIEVPSAAIQAATFAREVDFFSVGTNDLIQYTVAVDRSNEKIASLYSAAHPAVIALVRDVVRVARRAKIGISLCGEMAGEPEFALLLLGLGLRSLSVTPPAIPGVKKLIRSVSMSQCERIARRVRSFDSDREVSNYLRDEAERMMPEAFGGRSITY